MSLVFDFDWVAMDPAVAAEELRATSSVLEIWVDGECATMSYDHVNRGVRRSITVAMYPVAEWIAFNWWLLIRNSRVAMPGASRARPSRHNLVSAGDGYAWPDLRIMPLGEVAKVQWHRRTPAATDIVFATDGERTLPLTDLQASLSDVVERVLARLDESGIRGTPLQEEWARLSALDDEEADFCEASARLGLDPFSEGIAFAESLESVSSRLGPALVDDFLDAVEPTRLNDELAWVESGLLRVRARQSTNGAVFSMEQVTGLQTSLSSDTSRPWRAGYSLARSVRSALGLSPETPLPDAVPVHVDEDDAGHRAVNGVGLHPGDGTVVNLVLPRRLRDPERRFVAGRALWHAITASAEPFLLTGAASARQRAGRAFSAELLAPAEGIHSLLDEYHALDLEDVVSDIAEHFRTSELLVLHQIENQLSEEHSPKLPSWPL